MFVSQLSLMIKFVMLSWLASWQCTFSSLPLSSEQLWQFIIFSSWTVVAVYHHFFLNSSSSLSPFLYEQLWQFIIFSFWTAVAVYQLVFLNSCGSLSPFLSEQLWEFITFSFWTAVVVYHLLSLVDLLPGWNSCLQSFRIDQSLAASVSSCLLVIFLNISLLAN